MGDIDRIEAARGGTFEYRFDGQIIAISGPVGQNYQYVLASLKDPRHLSQARMPEWKRAVLRDAWAAHYDLPDFLNAQRLCYLIDRYSSSLTYDLHAFAGVDLIELWRARRWKTLLDLIDRLPPHSSYAALVANDEEHAQMLAEALAKRAESDEPSGPSLQSWTPEVEALTMLRNDVRALTYYTRLAAGDKSAKPPAPLPVPKTALQQASAKAEYDRRKSAHESLVARMLPHKTKG